MYMRFRAATNDSHHLKPKDVQFTIYKQRILTLETLEQVNVDHFFILFFKMN